ncbi:MAG: class I SAM-dependent methyltransferase [Balneolales bacterium]|nr:class I SAM-dependent methyltransferase [Balneolales bacterium]
MIYPKHWQDYALIDSGNYQKLEEFGEIRLIRPEPEASWLPKLSQAEWDTAQALFTGENIQTGRWLGSLPDSWLISYKSENLDLTFDLRQTKFKHVGIFPEQAANWEFIAESIRKLKTPQPKFLNLFAYTGGASLAAKACGADVTHVDSVKQVVTWANKNMQLSGLSDIRWIVEDAVRFVQREVRRGNTYHGIILDPPSFGRVLKGELWKLEEKIDDLMKLVVQLLDTEEHFLILNTYSPGFNQFDAHSVMNAYLPHPGFMEMSELGLRSRSGQDLPLGIINRVFWQK